MLKLMSPLALMALASCTTTLPPVGQSVEVLAPAPALADFSRWMDERYVAPFVAGDVPKWLEIFDDDAIAIHNGIPARKGKQAIAGFGNFVAANIRIEDMRVQLSEVSMNGTWAYTWGTYHSRLIMKSTGQPMPDHAENGKVFFLWERQTDGIWKIQVDMGNSLRETGSR